MAPSTPTTLRVAALAAALLAFGCATTQGSGSSRSSDPITGEEIQQISATDAYQVVEQLRPRWLRFRGRVSLQNPRAGEPLVYLDGLRHGRTESLRGISTDWIAEIRYLTAADATTRFGTGHPGGVILVSTRR